ncbi:hypothetical protein MUK42_36376 [Musa troglodytarum]|uniref:Myb/SANT-like DNA-binding domain-containing protein n=3 Tax=Musa troglodytarum TaxID=320322 RepID=A0A9E7KQ06_9LILI|nr:hypothetical protein MUK42_36376 [Musa troglodytarum]
MEGNSNAGSMMPGASYGVLGLQGNMHLHQGSMIHHPPVCDAFDVSGSHLQESDHRAGVSSMDYPKGERGRTTMSDDDEPSLTEDGVDAQNEAGRGKKGCPWQRMKWTDAMVRLLITAVSYVGEDAPSECGGRRKYAILQKKGKWKAISKVMAERGCYVSPQQCEDKFNDLNKRYKRLTDILGRGTSCKVVENPALLDRLNLSEKMKDDVRKILSSKHLFYEEMCSYHNCNRLNLPADPALQRSLQLALGSRDEHDRRRGSHEDVDEDDQSADGDDEEGDAEEHNVHGNMVASCFPKRMRHGVNHEEAVFGDTSALQNSTRSLQPQGLTIDMNQVFSEGSKSTLIQQHWVNSYPLQLEEKKLHIQAQMLELKKQRYKWQRFSKKKDRELNMMRMENERMKLENECLSLELRQKEMELDLTSKKTQLCKII